MLISYLVFFKNPFKQLKMSEHDPPSSAQNVLRCQFCENLVLFMYCDICHMQLCKAWGGGFFPIIPKEHKIIPFKKQRSTTKCPKHSSNICELYCKNCEVPICVQCASSSEHHGHTLVEMIKILEEQKSVPHMDLQELGNFIYPICRGIASNILDQKDDLIKKKHPENNNSYHKIWRRNAQTNRYHYK